MSERLSTEAARLVSAGRAGLAPSAEDIDRVRGRLLASVAAGVVVGAGGAGAAAASTGAAATAGGSAAATAGGIGLVKVVVVVAAVTGASVTGGVLVSRRAASDPPAAAQHRAAATVQHAGSSGHPERHEPARPAAPAPQVEPLPEPAGAASSPRGARPVLEVPAAPSLASEMDLLRRARAALRAGEPEVALEHLDRHSSQFPDSSLAPEAAAIRIEATCAEGDRETARALADRFVRRWPGSPLARRVPHLCGETP